MTRINSFILKDKLKGQLKEDPLIQTRGTDLYFTSLVNGYITNLYTLRGVPNFVVLNETPCVDLIKVNSDIFYLSGTELYKYPNSKLIDLGIIHPLSSTIINDYIYISNFHKLIIIDDKDNITEVHTGDIDDFYAYIPAGFPIEHDKGRLLSAIGNNIYFSDLWNYTVIDKRTNLIQMPSKVVLLCSVPDGLIIGTDDGIYLYTYANNFLEGRLSKIFDSPAKSVNYIRFQDKFYFMSEDGLLVFPEIKCLTYNRHAPITNYCKLFYVQLPYADLLQIVWIRNTI